MKKHLYVLALAAAFGASAAYAAPPGFYAGASIGQSESSDFPGSNPDPGLAALGLTSSTTTDDSDTVWKAFAGYRFSPYFAIEGAYTDLGEASAGTTITAPVAGGLNTTVESDAWTLSALGILPLTPNFSLFGRAGINHWDMDISTVGAGSGTIATASSSDDGTDWVYGAGGMFALTPNLSLRAEWERYELDDNDIDLVSAGLSWNF